MDFVSLCGKQANIDQTMMWNSRVLLRSLSKSCSWDLGIKTSWPKRFYDCLISYSFKSTWYIFSGILHDINGPWEWFNSDMVWFFWEIIFWLKFGQRYAQIGLKINNFNLFFKMTYSFFLTFFCIKTIRA